MSQSLDWQTATWKLCADDWTLKMTNSSKKWKSISRISVQICKGKIRLDSARQNQNLAKLIIRFPDSDSAKPPPPPVLAVPEEPPKLIQELTRQSDPDKLYKIVRNLIIIKKNIGTPTKLTAPEEQAYSRADKPGQTQDYLGKINLYKLTQSGAW